MTIQPFGIFASLAEYERGVIGGRSPKLKPEIVNTTIKRVNSGETILAVAESVKVHRNTLYKQMEQRQAGNQEKQGDMTEAMQDV